MARNYRGLDKDYADLRKKYGGEKELIKTDYGRHVPSKERTRFTYAGSNHPGGRIHQMPVPEPIWRSILREVGIVRSKKRLNLSQLAKDIMPSLGIIAGFFLLSGNITGNSISNLTNADANLAGAFAVVIGIIGLLISRRR